MMTIVKGWIKYTTGLVLLMYAIKSIMPADLHITLVVFLCFVFSIKFISSNP